MCHFSYSEYYTVIIIILVGLAVEYGKSHLSLASYKIAFFYMIFTVVHMQSGFS